MTKTTQLNYFDKTGKKVFTYYSMDDYDPYFYDDDPNACTSWIKAYIPLKSGETPRNTFHKMLMAQEIFTARQLKEYLKEQNRVITVTSQISAADKQFGKKERLVISGSVTYRLPRNRSKTRERE